ncbi:MAG TPA: polymer-forming cytoskeletal protein [Hyphomicrobiaceae bacterium]|nr:polymer-forming cytoskeletal protein [Hyphomicrobiaceae bacterium]
MLFNRKRASRHKPAPTTSDRAQEALARAVPPHSPHSATGAATHLLPAPVPVVPRLESRDIPRPDAARTQSVIDISLTIVGDLDTEGDVRLDGRVCGNVRCAQLIVDKDASITGGIVATEAIIRGRIMGTIRANTVVIQGSAQVESEITYGSLAIDDGASFEGAVRHSDNPLAEPPPVASTADLHRVAQTAESPAPPPASVGLHRYADGAPGTAAGDASDERAAAGTVALPAPAASGCDRLAANGHDRTVKSP